MTEERAVADFFQGSARTLWIVAFVLSAVVAAAGLSLAVLLPPRGEDIALNILLGVFGTMGAAVLVVCLATLKLRTSKWVADAAGVSYHCLGRKRTTLLWKEMKEVGYLKFSVPQKGRAAYYLYWSAEALSSRRALKGGETTEPKRCIGRYNAKGAKIVLYPLAAYAPQEDALIAWTREHFPHPMKHPELLQRAQEAAERPV